MVINHNGRNITVPTKDIEKYMKNNNISKEEAIQLWLEDEGLETNKEVDILSKKAKENKISHEASSKERKKRTFIRKTDEVKEKIIKIIADSLEKAGFTPIITNISKKIEFDYREEHFTIDLVRKNKNKKTKEKKD